MDKLSRNRRIASRKLLDAANFNMNPHIKESDMLLIEKYNMFVTVEDDKIYTYEVVDDGIQLYTKGQLTECNSEIAEAITKHFNIDVSQYGVFSVYERINIDGINEEGQRDIVDIIIGNKRGVELQELYKLAKDVKPSKGMIKIHRKLFVAQKIIKKSRYKNSKRNWAIKNVYNHMNGIRGLLIM